MFLHIQASFTKQKKYEAAVTAAESKYQNFLSRRTSQPIQNTCTNNDYSHFFGANIVFLVVQFKYLKSNLRKISMVLVPIGFIADSLIYIFCLQSERSIVRRTILSIFRRQFDISDTLDAKVGPINQ